MQDGHNLFSAIQFPQIGRGHCWLDHVGLRARLALSSLQLESLTKIMPCHHSG